MKQKITLKSLARELGYSVSTVSKALNNSPEISQSTKEEVQKLAKSYKYRPNAIATNLRNKSSKTLAVILPDVSNGFFAAALDGMEEMAHSKGYRLITCISHEKADREEEYIQMFSNGGVDGYIVAVSEEIQQQNRKAVYEQLLEDGIPLVMFDRVLEDIDCDKIVIDDQKSGMRAFRFLKERGADHIVIASCISELSVGKMREQGIREEASRSKNSQIITIQSENAETLQEDLVRHIETNEVDAIIALDQLAGVTSINAARLSEATIPDQLQIISYSDGVMVQNTLPKLTVVDQHAYEIGRKAIQRVLSSIQSTDEVGITDLQTIRAQIIERGTTRRK